MSDGMRDAERPFGAQKGMSGGTSLPLDLHAVEGVARMAMEAGECEGYARTLVALLAHCRALRAALRDMSALFGTPLAGQMEPISIQCERAASVLGAAQDGEGPT